VGTFRVFAFLLANMRSIVLLVNGKVREYAMFVLASLMRWAMNIAAAERELAERTKRFVKAELKRADMTYEKLAHRLREMGHNETKVSVANKLSRGSFSAAFFVAVMKAVGRETVNLQEF